MLVDRARKFLLSLVPLLLLLAACGGGGGNPGANPPTNPGATTGSLQVSINALPSGTNASVRVTGPNNFVQDLTASQTLSSLAPGSYTVTAASVAQNCRGHAPFRQPFEDVKKRHGCVASSRRTLVLSSTRRR